MYKLELFVDVIGGKLPDRAEAEVEDSRVDQEEENHSHRSGGFRVQPRRPRTEKSFPPAMKVQGSVWRKGSARALDTHIRAGIYILEVDVTVHSGHPTRGCISRVRVRPSGCATNPTFRTTPDLGVGGWG